MKLAWLCAALAAGCGGSAPKPAEPTETPAEPAAPAADDDTGLAWLHGHWVGDGDGTTRVSETWAAIDDVDVGVGFQVADGATRSFEVMLVHETDAGEVYSAMPGGAVAVDFAVLDAAAGAVTFANPEHDHPQQIAYRRTGDALQVDLSGGGEPFGVSYRRAEPAPAQALVDADIAFDADTEARGGAAWGERFEPQGVNQSYGGDLIIGATALAMRIDSLRDDGFRLRWTPTTSGLSPAGDAGFTAGRYRVERAGEVVGTGVYVTIWRRATDGRWRIPFDTGVATGK